MYDIFSYIFITHKNIFLYFSILISIPSILLYCAECLIIIRHKSFHNSFYTLFIVRAFTDLLYTLDSYYGYRIPNLFPEWFIQLSLSNWALALFYFLSSYSLMADNLTTGFLLFNRFTAIVCPLRHEQIWQKLMPFSIIFIFGIPIYAIGLFGIELQIKIENDENGNFISLNIIEKENTEKFAFYMEISTIWSVLFLLYCIILSLATMLAIRRRAKNQVNGQKQQNSQNKKLERKLWLFTFFTCLAHMLIALLIIGLYFAIITQNIFLTTLLNSQYSWVVDFGTVVLPSWLLLWASPSFRKQFFIDFLPKCVHQNLALSQQQVTMVKASKTTTVKASKTIKVQSLTRNS